LQNLVEKAYAEDTKKRSGYSMTGAITCGKTHLLPVAESIIKIAAYNIAGKKKHKKILEIPPEKPWIRHQGILDHAGITKTSKMVIHTLIRNQGL
jgi:hypothetical protein